MGEKGLAPWAGGLWVGRAGGGLSLFAGAGVGGCRGKGRGELRSRSRGWIVQAQPCGLRLNINPEPPWWQTIRSTPARHLWCPPGGDPAPSKDSLRSAPSRQKLRPPTPASVAEGPRLAPLLSRESEMLKVGGRWKSWVQWPSSTQLAGEEGEFVQWVWRQCGK